VDAGIVGGEGYGKIGKLFLLIETVHAQFTVATILMASSSAVPTDRRDSARCQATTYRHSPAHTAKNPYHAPMMTNTRRLVGQKVYLRME
jgi:hypothetical protein